LQGLEGRHKAGAAGLSMELINSPVPELDNVSLLVTRVVAMIQIGACMDGH
jgi:hypothetical protein